jgi:hypothetical protein
MLEWLVAGVVFFYAIAIFLFLEMWLPVKRPPPRMADRLDGTDRPRRRNA